MKIITGLSQSNLFLETIRTPIDSQTANLSTESNLSLTDSVLKLMKEVKSRGDDAIKEITLDLDNVKLEKAGDILVGDKGIFNVLTGKGEISTEPNKEGGRKKVYGIIRSKEN